MLSRASLPGWPQQRYQVIPSVGLYFSGFLEEIKTAADRAVTGITTARGSVGRPVTVVAVVAVVAIMAVVAVVAVLTVLAVVALVAVLAVVALVAMMAVVAIVAVLAVLAVVTGNAAGVATL